MELILFLVFGLIVGVIARLIVPGKEPGGWGVSMLLGIAGSLLGALIGRVLGFYRPGQPAGFLMSLLGAVLVLVAYHAWARHRSLPRGR